MALLLPYKTNGKCRNQVQCEVFVSTNFIFLLLLLLIILCLTYPFLNHSTHSAKRYVNTYSPWDIFRALLPLLQKQNSLLNSSVLFNKIRWLCAAVIIGRWFSCSFFMCHFLMQIIVNVRTRDRDRERERANTKPRKKCPITFRCECLWRLHLGLSGRNIGIFPIISVTVDYEPFDCHCYLASSEQEQTST